MNRSTTRLVVISWHIKCGALAEKSCRERVFCGGFALYHQFIGGTHATCFFKGKLPTIELYEYRSLVVFRNSIIVRVNHLPTA